MLPPSEEDKAVNGCMGIMFLFVFIWMIILAWAFIKVVNHFT